MPLTVLRKGEPGRTPLIAMHSFEGSMSVYESIALPPGTPLFAVEHRDLSDEDFEPFGSLEEQAQETAHRVCDAVGGAPFHLIGASFGALLAQMVATRAVALGGNPCALVLLDPPPAPKHWLQDTRTEAQLRARSLYGSCHIRRVAAELAGMTPPPFPIFGEHKRFTRQLCEALDYVVAVSADAAPSARQAFEREHQVVYWHARGLMQLAGKEVVPYLGGDKKGRTVSLMLASGRSQFYEGSSSDAATGGASLTRQIVRVERDQRQFMDPYGSCVAPIEVEGQHIPAINQCLRGQHDGFNSFLAEALSGWEA